MNKEVKFYVMYYNGGRIDKYDIIQPLLDEYNNLADKPKDYESIKNFIKDYSSRNWWGRVQYEIAVSDWVTRSNEERWDIHRQVKMNLELITDIFMKLIPVRRR